MSLRIDQDHSRFRNIVRGRIRQNLRKYISKGELLGRQGKDIVSIPIPQIDIPRFRFADKQQGGVGQGDGEPGDPLSYGLAALLFVGNNAVNGGNGNPLNDGLRCAGMNVVRLGTMTPDGDGDASWGPGLAAQGGGLHAFRKLGQLLHQGQFMTRACEGGRQGLVLAGVFPWPLTATLTPSSSVPVQVGAA